MSAWRDEAACRSVGTEAFFPTKGGIAPRQVQQAKDICRQCPVIAECLEFAMSVELGGWQRFGIYGGLSARERNYLHRKRAKRHGQSEQAKRDQRRDSRDPVSAIRGLPGG